jgi:hypothetical protein
MGTVRLLKELDYVYFLVQTVCVVAGLAWTSSLDRLLRLDFSHSSLVPQVSVPTSGREGLAARYSLK